MCLFVTLPVFSYLRRVNYRYCPTLLISFDYGNGYPWGQCENSDPAETERCAPLLLYIEMETVSASERRERERIGKSPWR